MSTFPKVFFAPSARTLLMYFLKASLFSGFPNSARTTSTYSGTCGRRAPTIMFAMNAFPWLPSRPPTPAPWELGALIFSFTLSSSR